MRCIVVAWVAILVLFSISQRASATSYIRAKHAVVSLVQGPIEGPQLKMGVEFVLEPGWHIYWKNPGDSGTAPKFRFEVMNGTASEIRWPAPERIRLGDLTNFGYQGRVVFPFTLQPAPPSPNTSSMLVVRVHLEWLVCRVECIPGFAVLETQPRLTAPGTSVPLVPTNQPLPERESPFRLRVVTENANGAEVAVESDSTELKTVREIDVFPEDGEIFGTKTPAFRLEGGKWKAELPWATNRKQLPKQTAVLLKIHDGTSLRAFETTMDLSPAVSVSSLARAIALAFLGGILLNLMPCVFPVLAIKVLSLVRESETPRAARRGGWLYGAGVLVTFMALAGALLLLRASGEQLGWGFQLQSPRFVMAMALLFFLIGLNFLGSFDVGYTAMRLGGELQAVPWLNSSFGTGILATLVATPCTAPFMGTALGASLFLPWWGALAVFASLATGMAAPFIVLCYAPSALSRLPRPGPWMERLKQFFAFPLFLTTVWLGWVLVQQSGESGFLTLGLAIVGIGLGTWLARSSSVPSPRWKAIGLLVGSASAALAITASVPVFEVGKDGERWENYDAARVEEARTNNVAVFIDFTAAWCLTCQWNKKSVLETGPVLELFKQHGVRLIRADWTDRSPQITAALAKYGRASVPLYVFLPPKAEAIILPELISRADIERLFLSGTPKP